MWNLETGLIVLIVWAMFLGYKVLYFHSFKEKSTYKEIGKIVLMVVLAIILYFAILETITFCRTGQLLNPKNIIFGQSTFLGSGFCMIKMNLWHPWILLVLIYAITLTITIKKLKFMGKQNDVKNFQKSSILFSLAILGLGIFSYYQGRSHDDVFFSVVYPAIIILGIFLDYLIENYRKYMKAEKVYKGFIILLITATLSNFATFTIYAIFNEKGCSDKLDKRTVFETNIISPALKTARILKNIFGKVDFVINFESYYYIATNQKDNKKFPAYVDIFSYEDCKKILDYMEENEITLCMQPDIFDAIKLKYEDELCELLNEKYKMVEMKRCGWIVFINRENFDKIDVLIKNEIVQEANYVWK